MPALGRSAWAARTWPTRCKFFAGERREKRRWGSSWHKANSVHCNWRPDRFKRRPNRSKKENVMKSLFLRALQVMAGGIALFALPLCAGTDHQFVLKVP